MYRASKPKGYVLLCPLLPVRSLRVVGNDASSARTNHRGHLSLSDRLREHQLQRRKQSGIVVQHHVIPRSYVFSTTPIVFINSDKLVLLRLYLTDHLLLRHASSYLRSLVCVAVRSL